LMESTRDSLVREMASPRDTGAAREGVRGGVYLGEYVDRIATELHERVEHQRAVLRKVLDERGPGREEIRYCPLVDCPRIEALRTALRETVDVLEETRSAFKSKRLEVMRKRLIEILAES
jgi:hypothetical protein